MITRIWHGWTTPENADAYEALLRTEVLIDIKNRNMPGFHGIQVLRRDLGHEVEFIKIMRFESIEAIRGFAGDDYEMAVVPAKSRALLKRFDERSQHYDTRIDFNE
jgi:antibiotic biosynthesis monooxygenase (ABM) superfamily enzyme